MKKRNIKSAFFMALFVACILISAGNSAKSIEQSEKDRRHSFYQRALYETEEAVTGMQATLKKLEITQSKSMETEYLSKISGFSRDLQYSLSELPVDVHEAAAALKFVNQAGDFADSALLKITRGGALSDEDRKTISALTNHCAEMAKALSGLIQKFNEGSLVFNDDLGQSTEFDGLTDPDSEYPVLLYDGPFSDSMMDKKMKGLGEKMYTKEEAEEALRAFLKGDIGNVSFINETNGDEKTYLFDIVLSGEKAEACVTKRGGKVLYVLPDDVRKTEALTDEACIGIAKDYLHKKGFGETQASYFRKFEGVITVNLAPFEDGVCLYPDLIKIQVDMQTGKVIGMEFTNYWMNHTGRESAGFIINTDDAKNRINQDLNVISAKKALIPYGTGEKYAIEISAKRDDDEFLIYLDALTGDEIMVYEVVHMEDGTIVQ